MAFDDMIYEAVELLDRNEVAQKHLINRLEHVVVDEVSGRELPAASASSSCSPAALRR